MQSRGLLIAVFLALLIVCMQERMGQVAARLGEIVLIEGLDFLVVVALAEHFGAVLAVEGLGTLNANVMIHLVLCRDDGLTAAVDAAAGTGHDLNEGVVLFACTDGVKQLAGIAGAVGHGDADIAVADLDRRFLDAIDAADRMEFNVLKDGSGDALIGGTKRCFHNAAGCAEDNGSTGGLAHHAVKVLLRKSAKVNAGFLDHPGQFAGRDDHIHIGHAVMAEFGTLGLKLLGGTGHDRDHGDLLGVNALLLSIIALDHGTGHLVRRLAGGQVIDEVRIVGLAEFDPAGGTAGDHRQGSAGGDALDELVGLLHDGEVSTEIGIKDLVKAKTAHGSDHLAGYRGAHGQTEFLAEGGTDGRSRLDHHVGLRIGKELPDLGGIILLIESAHRAVDDTLAAVDTAHLIQFHLPRRFNGGLEATVDRADDTDVLDVGTDRYAATAKDALVVVADDARGEIVNGIGVLGSLVLVAILNAQLKAQLLQLAVLAADAAEALLFMRRQSELQEVLAVLLDFRGVGLNHHAIGCRQNTSGLKGAGARIHNAHAAGTDFIDVFQEAQGGNTNTRLPGCLENRRSLGNLHLDAINCKANHFFHCFFPPLTFW